MLIIKIRINDNFLIIVVKGDNMDKHLKSLLLPSQPFTSTSALSHYSSFTPTKNIPNSNTISNKNLPSSRAISYAMKALQDKIQILTTENSSLQTQLSAALLKEAELQSELKNSLQLIEDLKIELKKTQSECLRFKDENKEKLQSEKLKIDILYKQIEGFKYSTNQGNQYYETQINQLNNSIIKLTNELDSSMKQLELFRETYKKNNLSYETKLNDSENQRKSLEETVNSMKEKISTKDLFIENLKGRIEQMVSMNSLLDGSLKSGNGVIIYEKRPKKLPRRRSRPRRSESALVRWNKN